MAKTPIVTAENAEQARAELAAIEAKEHRERIEQENARRAEARAAVQPIADLLAAETLNVAALVEAGAALPIEERTLAGLIRSIGDCAEQAKRQVERRMADTEPTDAPAA